MFWKGLKRVRSKDPPKQQRRRTFSGKSTEGSISHSEEEGCLDRSKHRCSSIESLLSLERSLVKYDDDNNIQLVPIVCINGSDTDNRGNHALSEVNASDDGSNDDNVDDDEAKASQLTSDDSNVGLDISEGNSISDSDADEVKTKKDSIQLFGKHLPYALVSPIVPIDGQKQSSEAMIVSELPKEVEKTNTEDKSRPCLVKNREEYLRDKSNRSIGSSVRFGSVEIHEHELQLGGSIPLRGPPLSLGWERASYQKFQSVDDHLDETADLGGRKSLRELQLQSQERVDILLDLGYTLREIRSSIRECGHVRMNRINSARFTSRNKCFLGFQKLLRKFFPNRKKKKKQATPLNAYTTKAT